MHIMNILEESLIHPDTRVLWINDDIGQGVVATTFIPRGTITYVQDELEILIPADSPLLQDPAYLPLIQKYACMDGEGNWELSWDHAKYVNHCCVPNTMDTAYGFEIAIRDIQPGEEITDEYGLFPDPQTDGMPLFCRVEECRKFLHTSDFDKYCDEWDKKVKGALRLYNSVSQPLERYLKPEIVEAVLHYANTGEGYKPIHLLKEKIGESGQEPGHQMA